MKLNAILCFWVLLASTVAVVTAVSLETAENRALAVLAATYPELQTAPFPWNLNGTGGLLPYCNWTGITCNANHEITKFSFVSGRDGFTLHGPFVHEWFNITTLRVLELRDQGIWGPMPSVIENRAEYLKTLAISGNAALNGTFPTTRKLIGDDVPYILNHVDFSNNDFEGPFPNIWLNPGTTLGYVYLSFVDFSFNRFSGPIVPNCTHAPSTIFLAHNQLNGTLPSCHWKVASTLDISYNNFSGAFPVMGTSYIDLMHNSFTDASAFFASTFVTSVRTFNAFGNAIATIPVPHSGFNFDYIDFTDNGMSGAFDDSWAAGSVDFLVVPYNQITSLWTPNSNLNSMIALDISYNPINAMPNGFETFATNLLQFFATSCSFSGTVPTAISGLPIVQRLGIGKNAFNSNIATIVIASSSIQYLDLSFNAFNGNPLPIFRALTAVQPLKNLYLQGNAFTMCDAGSLVGNSLQFSAPAVCLANQATAEIVTPMCTTAWSPCQLDESAASPEASPVEVTSPGPSMPNPAEVASPDAPSFGSPSDSPSSSPSSSPSDSPSSTPPSAPSSTPSVSGPSGSTIPSNGAKQMAPISVLLFVLLGLMSGLSW
jgi:hypothetical protein